MTTGKTIDLTRQSFTSKLMSLFFNMLYRFVIAFLTRSKGLLISWLQSPSTVISEPKKIKSDTVSTLSPSICHNVMGQDALIFCMLHFKPGFSLFSFTFIKRYFSSYIFAIRAVSSVYLRLLIFFLAILVPDWVLASLTLHMMYSASPPKTFQHFPWNFQMFKMDFKKVEEPETKLKTGSLKKQETSRKTSSSALLTTPKPLMVWITKNCGKFFKRWNTWPLDLPLEKPVYRSRSKS